jgi:hypothetical protein
MFTAAIIEAHKCSSRDRILHLHMPVAYLNAIIHHSHAIYEENHSFPMKGITLCPKKNGGAFFSNESNICDEVLVYLELQNIYCAALRRST